MTPRTVGRAPEVRHPHVRRLVLELGAVIVGWVDHETGEPHTVRAWAYGRLPHPEVARAATRVARDRVSR